MAVADGILVGFLALKPAAALLDQLFVAPARQGWGIGTLLLDHAKAAMPGGFTLHTAAEDARARAFYASAGLVEVGTGLHPELGHALVDYRWNARSPTSGSFYR